MLYFPATDPSRMVIQPLVIRISTNRIKIKMPRSSSITHTLDFVTMLSVATQSSLRLSVISLLACSRFALAKYFQSLVPANTSDILRTSYPLGNGRLGVMPIGPAGQETLNLNVDSLWSGGPFEAAVSCIRLRLLRALLDTVPK